jgi:light-harvesting complex I chlorophyll a/b binding protein 1
MTRIASAIALALLAGDAVTAFAPSAPTTLAVSTTKLYADVAEEAAPAAEEEAVEEAIWDPLMLSQLGKNIDTFPNMFPDQQFVKEAEIKHGRMSMLAWTGVWATHVGGFGLGWHIPGFPVEPDWTKAFGVFSKEQPALTALIIILIGVAEGENTGWNGDTFRGKGNKEPGYLGLDPFGLLTKLSPERKARYKKVEMANGRAAMIAMASLFAFESIPGSVPFMDVLGATMTTAP